MRERGPRAAKTVETPWRRTANGIALRVRLTPRASQARIEGIGATAEGPALLARVRAVPEDGAANAALTELVGFWLGCAKSAVTLAGGARSRIKTLAIAGDPDEIERRLVARIAADGA
jgi:hypothetical protein